ncbi:hypothetical protein [Caulobacter sp. NIBR1757]|uniref:hypothetical protein n=1 Tax=Caulobacter sp. NIBR1757 TaxID=3016000 RepID=UPI0022F0A859|nr:hypothetical protein [Caulobacter sp. NIBR1757]
MDNELQIRVFTEDAEGLHDHGDPKLSAFGGILPQIGDEIGQFDRWIGDPTQTGGNCMLVVKRRVFIRNEWVVLICDVRACTTVEYELFP